MHHQNGSVKSAIAQKRERERERERERDRERERERERESGRERATRGQGDPDMNHCLPPISAPSPHNGEIHTKIKCVTFLLCSFPPVYTAGMTRTLQIARQKGEGRD
jgi:hypothetical protein